MKVLVPQIFHFNIEDCTPKEQKILLDCMKSGG
nr:MAG TPA: hypothetical protein [Caudoviricetes sp.]